jgi:hypothetical protein
MFSYTIIFNFVWADMSAACWISGKKIRKQLNGVVWFMDENLLRLPLLTNNNNNQLSNENRKQIIYKY